MLARAISSLLALLLVAGHAAAQTATPEATAAVEADIVPPPVAPGTQIVLPALTPIYLRLDRELSSKKEKQGDRFGIHVDEDVRVGDAILIPAGSAGEGEVIDVGKAGIGGKPGELIVAARFVRVGDRNIRLRSFTAGHGADHSGESLALAASTVAVSPYGLVFVFIRGGAMVMPKDMPATAKTAEDVSLPALEKVLVDNTTKGELDDQKTN